MTICAHCLTGDCDCGVGAAYAEEASDAPLGKGWAILAANDVVDMRSVTDTRRGAIVNWLVCAADILVLTTWSDDRIENTWARVSKLRGVRVEEVEVRMTNPGPAARPGAAQRADQSSPAPVTPARSAQSLWGWIGTGLQGAGAVAIASNGLDPFFGYTVMMPGALIWWAIALKRRQWDLAAIQAAFAIINAIGMDRWSA